jgi:hypothetical protein
VSSMVQGLANLQADVNNSQYTNGGSTTSTTAATQSAWRTLSAPPARYERTEAHHAKGGCGVGVNPCHLHRDASHTSSFSAVPGYQLDAGLIGSRGSCGGTHPCLPSARESSKPRAKQLAQLLPQVHHRLVRTGNWVHKCLHNCPPFCLPACLSCLPALQQQALWKRGSRSRPCRTDPRRDHERDLYRPRRCGKPQGTECYLCFNLIACCRGA